jgi:hypothetical protein
MGVSLNERRLLGRSEPGCRELKKQKPGAGPGFCEAENEPYSAARASMSSAVSLK